MRFLPLFLAYFLLFFNNSEAALGDSDSPRYSCGLIATYIFLKKEGCGKDLSCNGLRSEFENKPQPDSLSAIKDILGHHGCETVGISADLDSFLLIKMPAIVYLRMTGKNSRKMGHFSVVTSVSQQNGVTLCDPLFKLSGQANIAWSDFKEIYGGFALTSL